MLRLVSFRDPMDELLNIDSLFWPESYFGKPRQRNNVWRSSVDVSGYRPDEIKVNREKSQDNKELLIIEAKHSHNDDFHQMKKSVLLPDSIDLEKLQLHLSQNGHLLIQAPYKPKEDSELSVISDFLNEPFSKLANTKIVPDENGGERFEVDFDVRGFKPEEIKIQQTADQLTVEAKHTSSTDGSTSVKEMRRSINIPTGVTLDQITSQLNEKDGLLRLTAPYIRPEKPAIKARDIPVQLTQPDQQQSIQSTTEHEQ